MKLTTITIPAIEMTRAEYEKWWDHPWDFSVEGKKVQHWMSDDGHNDIRLEGEDFYRPVVITDR